MKVSIFARVLQINDMIFPIMRKNHLYSLLIVSISILLASCGSSYTIKGTTDIPLADGQKFYLNVFAEDDMKSIDSCGIVHGQFHFSGSTDTVKLAFIISDNLLMPVILEEGEISADINSKSGLVVSGTPLNDQFLEFRKQLEQMEGEYADLYNKQADGIKKGLNEDSLNTVLTKEARVILEKREKYIKDYIKQNMDNPLGVAAFEYITTLQIIQGAPPQLTPMIDEIISLASEDFKNDPYVKSYISQAKVVEGILNGTIEQPGVANAPQAQGQQPQTDQQTQVEQQSLPAEQQPQESQSEDDDQELQELQGIIPTPKDLAKPSQTDTEKK